MEQSFEQLVKNRILQHDFSPICIEHEIHLKANRRYDNSLKGKLKHKKWRKTEKGITAERARGKRYRDKNRNNPEYMARRRAVSTRCFRRKRAGALMAVLVLLKEG